MVVASIRTMFLSFVLRSRPQWFVYVDRSVTSEDIVSKGMEEYFFDLVIDVLSQEHESDHLKWSESLELDPLDVEVEEICPFLLFFGVGTDLFNRPIDEVLGVPVDCT